MADIVHCLRMSASPEDLFRAVTEDELLRPWWAHESTNDNHLAVRPLAISDGRGVAWRCVDGPPEWIGTDIVFAFAQEGRETVVRFAHRNWRETNDAFARCTTKWGRILMALQARVETPEADDLA
ncbi:MAG: Aha1 domain protein [Myxococcaceae bacterium]|jgi:hypothetical protein|nr:Aha1 domain protein [Myxococcaceae bacterium]MEA2749411.1 hypothetical protein [Myxococcales bacterium]